MPRVTDLERLPGLHTLANATKYQAMRQFLDRLAFRDRYFHIDDFTDDAINLDRYALEVTAVGGESAFAIDVTLGAGHGAITTATGGTTNNASSLIGPLIYKGDKNCGMFCRVQLANIEDVEFEVGFIAAKPASNASGVTDVDTPTVAMTDGAVVHMNTGQTITGPAFVTEGSTANQGIKATELDLITPANATYMDITIQLLGDDAICIVDTDDGLHQRVAHNTRATGNTAGYIEGGTAVAPWLYISTLADADKTMTCDVLALWSDR